MAIVILDEQLAASDVIVPDGTNGEHTRAVVTGLGSQAGAWLAR